MPTISRQESCVAALELPVAPATASGWGSHFVDAGQRREAAAELAVVLRICRLRRGMSQEEVAFAAGLSVNAYGCLERGQAASGGQPTPKLDTIVRLFEVLQIQPQLSY